MVLKILYYIYIKKFSLGLIVAIIIISFLLGCDFAIDYKA